MSLVTTTHHPLNQQHGQIGFYYLACLCTGVAFCITLLQHCLNRRQSSTEDFEKIDGTIRKAARGAFYSLLSAWVTERGWRCRAWIAIFMATLQQVCDEATWAFIVSKMSANVYNAITELNKSHDMEAVYAAFFQELMWNLCWSVPLWQVVWPITYRLTRLEFQSFLTRRALEEYLDGGGHAFYHIKVAEMTNGIDNPEQRIEQDTAQVAQDLFDIYTSIISAIAGPIMWMHVVAKLTNATSAFILLGAATLRTSIAMLGFGSALVMATRRVMIANANFRYGLTRIRDSAEEIALGDGDPRERKRAEVLYQKVVLSIWNALFVKLRYHVADGLVSHFPHLLLWLSLLRPIYNGTLKVGDAFRIHWGYDQISKVFEFAVNNFESLANLQANLDRIHTLLVACKEANDGACYGDGKIEYEVAARGIALGLEGVRVSPPGTDSSFSVGGVTMTCLAGEGLLIQADSGMGKTSLLRAVSRLWQTGVGRVSRPGGESSEFVKFIPSRCYLPIGTLIDVVFYPRDVSTDTYPDDLGSSVEDVLIRSGLEYLVNAWGVSVLQDWKPLLSPGEMQRIAFARLLLHLKYTARNATLVLLDESTGNMDIDTEHRIYLELRQELRQGGGLMGLISVGHRPTLRKFHESVLLIGLGGESDAGLDVQDPLASGTWYAPGGTQVPWRHLRNLTLDLTALPKRQSARIAGSFEVQDPSVSLARDSTSVHTDLTARLIS